MTVIFLSPTKAVRTLPYSPSWSMIKFTTCFHEFFKHETTNIFTNTSQLKNKINFLLAEKVIFSLNFEENQNQYISGWKKSWKHVMSSTYDSLVKVNVLTTSTNASTKVNGSFWWILHFSLKFVIYLWFATLLICLQSADCFAGRFVYKCGSAIALVMALKFKSHDVFPSNHNVFFSNSALNVVRTGNGSLNR